MPDEKFDLKKWFSGLINPITWGKSIQYLIMILAILFVIFAIKNTFFPPQKQVNKPITIVTPFAKVEKIDNTSSQVVVEKEKPWEVSVGAGAMEFDGKRGYLGGVAVKRKFDKLFGIF